MLSQVAVTASIVTHWIVFSGLRLLLLPVKYFLAFIMPRLRWVPSSKAQLIEAEKKVLSLLEKPYEILDVEIGSIGDVENCKLHTIKIASSDQEKKNTSLVMIHGFGNGAACFVPCLDALSAKRDVYAIDMLGFGLSSRTRLSPDPMEAEKEMVDSIELWRQKMNLEQMVLLGHSLGGFVASAYALRYPSRARHLILEDTWGFPEYDAEMKSKFPILVRTGLGALKNFNCFAHLRAMGPCAPSLMRRIIAHHHPYMRDFYPEAPHTIPEYIYHCTMRRPTGEEFFRKMCPEIFGFTRYPLICRMPDLSKDIKITFIHGEDSFIPKKPSEAVQRERGEENTKIYVVEGTRHSVHLAKPTEFNNLVLEALAEIGEN